MTNNSKLTTAAQKQCEVRRQGNQIHFNILIIRLIRKRLCISAEQLRHRTMESYGQQMLLKSVDFQQSAAFCGSVEDFG